MSFQEGSSIRDPIERGRDWDHYQRRGLRHHYFVDRFAVRRRAYNDGRDWHHHDRWRRFWYHSSLERRAMIGVAFSGNELYRHQYDRQRRSCRNRSHHRRAMQGNEFNGLREHQMSSMEFQNFTKHSEYVIVENGREIDCPLLKISNMDQVLHPKTEMGDICTPSEAAKKNITKKDGLVSKSESADLNDYRASGVCRNTKTCLNASSATNVNNHENVERKAENETSLSHLIPVSYCTAKVGMGDEASGRGLLPAQTTYNQSRPAWDVPNVEFVERNGDLESYTAEKICKLKIVPDRSLHGNTMKKLLVLDINGLLVDIVACPPPGYQADKKLSKKSVFVRPYCYDFLSFCFQKFDVAIWSSRRKENLDKLIDFLMGDMKNNLLFCWDQSKCTVPGLHTIKNVHKPLFLKELKKIWNKDGDNLPWEKGYYSPSNTLLLDDSPDKALQNPPHTAIFPQPYVFTDANDQSLGPGGNIRIYLEEIAEVTDVRKYVQQHPFGQSPITAANPSWKYYVKVFTKQARCNHRHVS